MYGFERPKKGRAYTKGAFDAETESVGSYISFSSNWDDGGNSDHLRNGDSNIAPGDGDGGHCEKDRPAVCKMPYGPSGPEQLRQKVPEQEIIRHTV